MSRIARIVVLRLLRGYQWILSPLLPPACRFVPTCSEYAVEAVERYGALHGGWMAARRVLRCHPFGGGGYDPVAPNSRQDIAGPADFESPVLRPIER